MNVAPADHGLHVSLAAAVDAQPEEGNLAASMARLRGADLEYYAPLDVDLQRPHSRDELYLVATGSGTLTVGEERFAFTAGDVLYVPARAEHRFSDFTEDFATWVIFYGPEYSRH